MRPDPALLERLMTSRLQPSRAEPSVGTGERRSRAKGAGIEFIDHRPYQPGDDTRHLDPYILARSGEAVIREYALMRQVPVTVVLDTSPSLGGPKSEKTRLAGLAAQIFGFVGLAHGDRVQLVTQEGGRTKVSMRLQGTQRAEIFFAAVSEAKTGEAPDLAPVLREMSGAKGLIILISDFWDERLEAQLALAEAAGQEVLGLCITSPEDSQPTLAGRGIFVMQDAETGEDIEVRLDQSALRQYTAAYEAWQQSLQEQFRKRSWHFLTLGTQEDLTDFFLRRCRSLGILS